MQDDDEIALVNACADLVGLRKAEAFPRLLLESKQPGEWVCVCEVCHRLGVPVADLRPGVFATWLPDPMAHNGYAVILFYDDESKWSMVAHYNRERLLGSRPSNEAIQPNGAALPASAPKQAAPAAEL